MPGQVPNIRTVQKTVEVAQAQYIVRIVDVAVVLQRQMPTIQMVQRSCLLIFSTAVC